ncbi:MAG: hypothetical protein ACK40G_09540 [Cytophagaceae bacterium]
MLRKIALFISVIFHPLMMPTYLFSCIVLFAPEILNPLTAEGRTYLVLLIFITTFLLPVFLISMILQFVNKTLPLAAFLMDDRRSRVIPFFLTACFYSGITYLFHTYFHMNLVVVYIMASISFIILILALINVTWKISAHAMGLAGTVGLLMILSKHFPDTRFFYPVITLVFISGVVLSARMFLKAHDYLQIVAGLVIGFAASIYCFEYLIR